MNPSCYLEVGTLVKVVKDSKHNNSNAVADATKTYEIVDILWDGRTHNRYVSYVSIRDKKSGTRNFAILDQLNILNRNYEPCGSVITCTSCGAVIPEPMLRIDTVSKKRCCIDCNALEPETC